MVSVSDKWAGRNVFAYNNESLTEPVKDSKKTWHTNWTPRSDRRSQVYDKWLLFWLTSCCSEGDGCAIGFER